MSGSNARMRVLHVMEAMVRGGAESLIVEHARCAGAGVEVWVCALNREGPALASALAAGARRLELPRSRAPWPFRPFGRIVALARAMRAAGVDVVNGHNPTGSLYATLAGRLAGVPVIVRTEHSLHYPGRHSPAYPLIERVLTQMTRRVVCVCRAVLESHVRRLPWATRRFVIVANGISPAPHTRPRQEVRAELGVGASAEVVLTVGSLTPQKAQHVLLDAFAAVRAARTGAILVVAGDGPLRGDLEARARTLGIEDAVRLVGAREDVADLIEAADVFALSSVREGLPITLLEAMRGARPAVVTRIGGMPEAIEDGVTGRIVEPGDPAAFAAALLTFLEDPTLRAAAGAAAEHRWAAAFTAGRMVAETEALYRDAGAAGGAVRVPEEARHAAG